MFTRQAKNIVGLVILFLLIGSIRQITASPPAPEKGTGTATPSLADQSIIVDRMIITWKQATRAHSHPAAVTMSEDFEGAWPTSGWEVIDNSNSDGGEYLWGKRDCHPHTGSFAAWSVGGGAHGSALPCSSDYPNNVETLAQYGPFDLSSATTASLTYHFWGRTEGGNGCPYDFFFVGNSTDAQSYLGSGYCGNWSNGGAGNGYHQRTLDLSNRLGQSQVWVAFVLVSDSSVTDIGITIDDVTLDITGSTPPTDTPTSTFTPTPTDTPTNTATPTESPTSTFTPTPTNTPANTPTYTPTPTNTPTITPTVTATDTPSATPTSSATTQPTDTPTATSIPTSTTQPTDTPTPTITSTPELAPPLTPTIEPPEIFLYIPLILKNYVPPTPTPTATSTYTPTPTNTPTPGPLQFAGMTDQSKGVDFDVKPDLSAVVRIQIEYRVICSSVIVDGTLEISKPSGWPITNRQFTIETTAGGGAEDVFTGEFDPSFTSAQGTWRKWMVIANDPICSNTGTWSALYQPY